MAVSPIRVAISPYDRTFWVYEDEDSNHVYVTIIPKTTYAAVYAAKVTQKQWKSREISYDDLYETQILYLWRRYYGERHENRPLSGPKFREDNHMDSG